MFVCWIIHFQLLIIENLQTSQYILLSNEIKVIFQSNNNTQYKYSYNF